MMSEEVESVRKFTVSEDWLAVIVGLAILFLALVGIINEGWLIL